MRWIIEYDNEVNLQGDGFREWWTVTDGESGFRCDDQEDAKWLCDVLNSIA